MSDDNQFDTVEDLRPSGAAGDPSRMPFGVEVGGLTHVGKVRPNNEDQFHVIQFGRYLRTLTSSLPGGEVPEEAGEPGYGYAVADGVGGGAGGGLASRMAISLLIELALQTPDWVLGREDDLLAKVLVRFSKRFQAVNQAVLSRSGAEPGLRGMGTTLSVAVSLGDDLLVTHIGDSRVYQLRQGRLRRLTRDHTASRQVADPAGGDAVRFRRVLTRAIGMPEGRGDPDLSHFKLADGDRLLLCTDGLTDMVAEDTIARELDRAPSAAAACQSLVDRALEGGGKDNVTAVVATYRLPVAPKIEPPA